MMKLITKRTIAALLAVFAVAVLLPVNIDAPDMSMSTTTVAAQQTGGDVELEDPLGIDANLGEGENPVNVLIGRAVKALLGLSGAVALLMFTWGGFQWLTSGGNPDRIKKGKQTLIWAVLGLVVIFTAYALVDRIIQALAGAT